MAVNRNVQWSDLSEDEQVNLAGKMVRTLKHGEMRIQQDSVAGTKCLIVYRDEKPIATVWDTDDLIGVVRKFTPEVADQLIDICHTVRTLGGGFDEIQGALGAYFRNLE